MIVHTLHQNASPVTGDPRPEGFTARFVDSVNGSDDNDGLSASTAYATLARVTQDALATNWYVLLARGSRFREELTDLPTGVRVRAYGSGARPIIDGRDIAANASFSKTTGRTNVYEIAWSHDFDADGGKSAHRVWEDEVMLTRAADLAACDATPGSFYASAPTAGGPDTIYVHPAGSTNPTTNGREYAITKRRWCVQLYESYLQAHVTGLKTIGNAHADGSLCIDGYAEDCVAQDGRVHNAFILGEAVGCQALGIEPATGTLFVSYYDNSGAFGGPATRNVIYRNCTADAQASLATDSGFFVHTDNGGRVFGTVQYEDCRVVGMSGGFGGSAANNFIAYRCTFDDVIAPFGFQPVVATYILGGSGKQRSSVNAKLFNVPSGSFVAHGLKAYSPGGGEGPIGTAVTATSSDVHIERCTIVQPNGGISRFFRGNVTVHRTVLVGANIVAVYLGNGAANVTDYEGVDNCFCNTNTNGWSTGKEFGGADFYSSLATWQSYLTGVGFSETGSTGDNPDIADAENLDFTIGNSAVLAMGAGAEIDEEDDPELQALWVANRVTEV